LAGGTGTYAFLIGLAWWDAGALQVEQFFMRDFGEEHAILHEVAARIAERPVLVTFNGKAFDWPLLENRFTMTRSIAVPRLAAHLDLLHPARALWKLRLGSVRLVDLERHVLDAARLGWHRQDDVLASLIPQQYFDYLRGGPAEPLAAVVRHNQMDLRGLAALVGKIDALLTSDDGRDVESLDLFGLSRYLQRRGDSHRAHSACTQAIDLGLPKEHDGQARRELALLAKRRGEHEQAASLWHELTADESAGIYACVQLAIHYERRAKRLESALEFARLALAKVRRLKTNSLDGATITRNVRMERTILNRVARLEHRMRLSRMLPALPMEGPPPKASLGAGRFTSE
jgi:tetratricopeptide (TPR) repeat protein